MSHSTKPKLDINSQISYLETKGIKFSINNKLSATNFLTNNSYFYKLKAYCKNYDKKVCICGGFVVGSYGKCPSQQVFLRAYL